MAFAILRRSAFVSPASIRWISASVFAAATSGATRSGYSDSASPTMSDLCAAYSPALVAWISLPARSSYSTCAVFALNVSLTARARRYAETGSLDTSGELGMPEPQRGGGGALSGTTFGLVAWCKVWPANVFRAHSWSARSGSMVPSGFGVIRLVAIAFRTALSARPRVRAYARIETPIRLTPQVRTTVCLDSFAYRGAHLPCAPE